MRLTTEKIQYAQNEPHILMNAINSVFDVLQGGVYVKSETPTENINQAVARPGTTRTARFKFYSADPAHGGVLLDWLNKDAAATIADTVTGTSATIADTTPAIVNGVLDVVVTLPAASTGYLNTETVTLTVKVTVGGIESAGATYVATIVDSTVPTLASATVDGTSLVLTFSETLDNETAELPAAADFAVKVADEAVNVSSVAVSNTSKTVTLTLASAATAGQDVTCSYTPNATAANKIKDIAGNLAAAFEDIEVTNETA